MDQPWLCVDMPTRRRAVSQVHGAAMQREDRPAGDRYKLASPHLRTPWWHSTTVSLSLSSSEWIWSLHDSNLLGNTQEVQEERARQC